MFSVKIKRVIRKYFPIFINVYTIWVLYMLFFASFRYNPNQLLEIKTTPFETIDLYMSNDVFTYNKIDSIKNIIGNIVIFIPYGFLGIMYSRFNKFWVMLISFLVVINIIEFSQYYLKRGYADIDDVILNTTGVLLGFFIYKRFVKE